MVAPYAEIYERDESGYINSEQSINTFLASWAPCGPVGTRQVTNSKEFYKKYTPNGRYDSGYPVAFLNAEAIFDVNSPVYFCRVLPEDALYGGAIVKVGSSTAIPLANGITSPEAYAFAEATSATTAEKISVLCKADVNGSLGGSYFYLPGRTSFVYLQNTARAEIAKVIVNADVNKSLNSTYFIMPGQKYYVWFNVASSGTDPRNSLTSLLSKTGVPIAIAQNATAATVATAIATAFNNHSDFTVSANGSTLTITAKTAGKVAHGNSGTTGFNYLTSTIGVDASNPVAISGKTAIQASIAADATAAQVATAINTALSSTADFTGAINADNNALLEITAATAGYMLDAQDGEVPTNFVFNTITEGSSQAGSDAMLFYSADPNNLNISFKLYSNQDYPSMAPQPNTFVVEVYRDNILETSITCSRIQNLADDSGNSLYVEDAMLASNYLRCLDNKAVRETESPVSITTAVAISGGTPGSLATTADMTNAVQAWKKKDDFDITLMLTAGYTDPAYVRALEAIAKNRGDCCVINSIPYSVENTGDYLQNIVNYRKNTLNINSSYIATFSSNLQVFNSGLNKTLFIPSDGHIAGAIINASRNYEIFYPILGFKRGVLSNVLDVKHRYDKSEMDALYNAQINPIRFVPGRGIVIWGQKTMQSSSSSLDRLNARLLLCSIKPQLQTFLEDNIGELNTQQTRDKATLTISGLLERIKAKQGILDYEVSCDPLDPNNPYKLVVNARIQITPAIEYVDMTIILTPAGVEFS